MSYYQSPYGVPPPPFAAPIASLPPGYPGFSQYGYPQQQSAFQYAAPQPYASPYYQPTYPTQSPYMAQQSPFYQQLYAQQTPYAQQNPYAQQTPYQQQTPYPQQSPYTAPAPAPAPMQQQYQQPHYGQPLQGQVGNVAIDSVGLPQVPGDMALQFPQTFIVEEKILSATRDSFFIKDQQGAMRYKVDGSFTIHEHKTMKDMHGQVLLRLRESRLKMREKITIFNASNIPLMTLQKASAIQIGSKRVHGFYGNRISGNPAIIITGNYNNTSFKINNAAGTEIASIRRRKFSIKNMTTGQDTYEVTINQGSPAFVCFLTVALDEIYED